MIRKSLSILAPASLMLAACAAPFADAPLMVPGVDGAGSASVPSDYLIGPGDKVQVFVWRNDDLSAAVSVRPDGRISVPLIEDLPVAGQTPTAIAREIERRLADYVREPKVTVIMQDFVGPFDRQVRVVGEAAKPQAIPYRTDMTVLDVLIAAGGLTQFAAGNQAVIVRKAGGRQQSLRVRLADLIKDGDMTANAQVAPGDVLLIPQSWF